MMWSEYMDMVCKMSDEEDSNWNELHLMKSFGFISIFLYFILIILCKIKKYGSIEPRESTEKSHRLENLYEFYGRWCDPMTFLSCSDQI